MAEPIIKVRGLSKSFIISHQSKERYVSLRDVIANRTKQMFNRSKKELDTKEEFHALHDVSFDIQQGDRVGIIGRNGAGKSTLLKILSRITDPSRGRIEIQGRVASLLEVGTGFHPELTGRENVFLNGAILGMSRSEIRSKFDEIVAFAEVEQFLDTPVKRYSSGMYVRLAFAVAAHLEPEILIVDEVLAVGDAAFQKKCLGKMKDVSANDGRTVLFVSHSMGTVSQLCNRGILLNKGGIESEGLIDSIIEKYINNNQSNDNYYLISDKQDQKKINYFTSIYTTNLNNQTISDFSFDEEILLKFEFIIRDLNPNLQIGIGINDKLGARIATIIKPVLFFNKKDDNKYSGFVKFPKSLLAPNSYSFVLVLWIKDIIVYDNIENTCSVRIHDTGTELSMYEGIDYGNVILNPYWSNG